VDTGPEFRLQAIRAGIKAIDLLLITHSHADHLHGLDDVRPLTYEKTLNVFANSQCCKEIRERFGYIWSRKTQIGGGLPRIALNPADGEACKDGFYCGGIKITPLPALHGNIPVLGWKFEEEGRAFVYLTDVKTVPPETLEKIVPCELLITGAIKIVPHNTHFSFGEALDFARTISLSPDGGDKLREVYFTHITHNHPHRGIENYCARWKSLHKACNFKAAPAYDGLKLSLP